MMSRHHRRSALRGYTLVELMMAIAVFGIGVSGIIALQKVAAAANEHSKALSVATNVAQAWIDALKADSSLYVYGAVVPPATVQLVGQINSNNATWFRPTWKSDKMIGAGFDGLGNPIDEGNGGDPANAQFCVHLRLTNLYANSPGMNVIRTEVRVFWPRADATLPAAFCTSGGMQPNDVTAASNDFHFLYQVSAVRQQQ
jgi:prepilin-type N-terminal cleavage/methylation domain-containing protein